MLCEDGATTEGIVPEGSRASVPAPDEARASIPVPEGALGGASAGAEGFDPVAYINEPRWHDSRLGLERITELMERLGNPQEGMRFIHVAGTNGKGSTCAFTASILQSAGYRTGLFTSPYIIEFADRIRVDGKNISPQGLLEATLIVRDAAEAMEDHPTEFELMTAVALVHFRKAACDAVVLEVGLGGRFDSTNVISNPLVCAIAPIALDHTAILGDTIGKIAFEKAGIIKAGAAVVGASQDAAAQDVIRAACAQQGCNLTWVDESALQGSPKRFSYKGHEGLALSLLGSYQTRNAALAIEIAWALDAQGLAIPECAIREGLAKTRWPARFEIVGERPAFVVDGGHNPQGALALADSLRLNFPGAKAVFLIGILADKDFEGMIGPLIGLAQAFVCVQPPNPRALPASELARAITCACKGCTTAPVLLANGFSEGVATACELAGADGIVCACGSLYSVASVMEALRSQNGCIAGLFGDSIG